MAEYWSRIAQASITKHVRKKEVNVLRSRKFLALLEKKGRVTFNHSGRDMDWRVEYYETGLTGYGDMDVRTFQRIDRWKTATLPWRGYYLSDFYTKVELLANRGVEGIIKLNTETTDRLMDNLRRRFCDELFLDGNAAGREKKMHGVESFLGDTGTTAADNKTIPPSDTFAGLSTVLGTYGGTWDSSSTWPAGTGDSQYDFWSPIVLDYTGTGWAASTDTWANNCLEVVRYGLIKSRRSPAADGMTDLVLLNDQMYVDFLTQLASKEQILIERGMKQSPLIALGFNDVVNYDGADVTWDWGVPGPGSGTNVGTGYGINTSAVEIRSQQGTLFDADGPHYDEATVGYRIAVDCLGNVVWNPRTCFKMKKNT